LADQTFAISMYSYNLRAFWFDSYFEYKKESSILSSAIIWKNASFFSV